MVCSNLAPPSLPPTHPQRMPHTRLMLHYPNIISHFSGSFIECRDVCTARNGATSARFLQRQQYPSYPSLFPLHFFSRLLLLFGKSLLEAVVSSFKWFGSASLEIFRPDHLAPFPILSLRIAQRSRGQSWCFCLRVPPPFVFLQITNYTMVASPDNRFVAVGAGMPEVSKRELRII